MKKVLSSRYLDPRWTVALLLGPITGLAATERPNILWIVGEDASPHIGCYGETLIRTPNLDRMASRGVRFAKAFVTSPVCSPSRSALITGMYPTTLGAQNHRSQQTGIKGGGNSLYYRSYELPDSIQLLPELFQEAGYFTALGAGPDCRKLGKTDYNFVSDPSVYHGADWRLCPPDRPFFAQIMLQGGKEWKKVEPTTDPELVQLPPQYPDHPVLRRRWAAYLETWVQMDREVGEILSDLEEAGVADNTIVFFFTDHGVVNARGKQFLYDEGIQIPLIVRFGHDHLAGTVRSDLVLHIDVAAASLGLAGIPGPKYLDGLDIFDPDYEPRSMIVSARDRCDETVDIIRSIRTDRFKYVRNFLSFRSHTQPNETLDHQDFLLAMRELHGSGQLTELQSRIFAPARPVEELYDLRADPHETVNLAEDEEFTATLRGFRNRLYEWMEDSGDLGLIPEPILEEMGRTHGNKVFVLQQPGHKNLVGELIRLIEAGEEGDVDFLQEALRSSDPSHRYWASVWLGVNRNRGSIPLLQERLSDPVPAVRIAAASSLHQLGGADDTVGFIANEIGDYNLINGLFAMRALEWMGDDSLRAQQQIEEAKNHPYEYVRRIANRLSVQGQ